VKSGKVRRPVTVTCHQVLQSYEMDIAKVAGAVAPAASRFVEVKAKSVLGFAARATQTPGALFWAHVHGYWGAMFAALQFHSPVSALMAAGAVTYASLVWSCYKKDLELRHHAEEAEKERRHERERLREVDRYGGVRLSKLSPDELAAVEEGVKLWRVGAMPLPSQDPCSSYSREIRWRGKVQSREGRVQAGIVQVVRESLHYQSVADDWE